MNDVYIWGGDATSGIVRLDRTVLEEGGGRGNTSTLQRKRYRYTGGEWGNLG